MLSPKKQKIALSKREVLQALPLAGLAPSILLRVILSGLKTANLLSNAAVSDASIAA